MDNVEETVYTMHPVMSNAPKPWMQEMLWQLLNGVMNNQVGLMEAKHRDTGDPKLLLVGLVQGDKEGSTRAFPLAELILTEDHGIPNCLTWDKYIAPDGKGGWIGETMPELSYELDNVEAQSPANE